MICRPAAGSGDLVVVVVVDDPNLPLERGRVVEHGPGPVLRPVGTTALQLDK